MGDGRQDETMQPGAPNEQGEHNDLVLTTEEASILDGSQGPAAAKAMEMIVALGRLYGADRLVRVRSVQVAGVSYHNLGEAGLE